MKQLLLSAALCLTGMASAASDLPGYDRFAVQAQHRGKAIEASLWYPAERQTYRTLIGENAVFKGNYAYVGGAIQKGPHPLILFSHGSGGNMDAMSWLLSGLAQQGAVVLAVNHQGSTSGDSSPRRSVLVSDRTRDLSLALDHLLADPAFAGRIDASRIIAAALI